MNSTDHQILSGAIELLNNKGLELRVQRLEMQNLRLLWLIRKASAALSELAEKDFGSPKEFIDDLNNDIEEFPLEHFN